MIEIYTDGASRGNPGLAACGFILYLNNKYVKNRVSVFRKSTNNRMEVSAIIMALYSCITNKFENEEIKLYSDSAWAIGAVSKNWNISCNLDLVTRAKEYLQNFSNIEFIKVKGHSDNKGNISIDTLLNQAMDHPVTLYVDEVFEGGNQ